MSTYLGFDKSVENIFDAGQVLEQMLPLNPF